MTLFSPLPFISTVLAALFVTIGIYFSAVTTLARVTPQGATNLQNIFMTASSTTGVGGIQVSEALSTTWASLLISFPLVSVLQLCLPVTAQELLARDIKSVLEFSARRNRNSFTSSPASSLFISLPPPTISGIAASFVFFLAAVGCGSFLIRVLKIGGGSERGSEAVEKVVKK